MRLASLFLVASLITVVSHSGEGQSDRKADPTSPEELILLAAGLDTDEAALLDFFRGRMQAKADLDELLTLARQLGDSDADKRAQAAAKLLGRGPWAVPALRYVVNDLQNPRAAEQARHCLEWLEGKHAVELPVAAAKVLAARKSKVAGATLIEFLPFAGDPAVVEGVKAALEIVATQPGEVDAALLAALKDPLPLRRAIAVEVLAASRRAEVLPAVREVLKDAKAQVKLRAALALTQQLDELAVATLIDLLAELPTSEIPLAEQALKQLAGEWSPSPTLVGDDDLSRKIRHEVWAGWWRTLDGPALLAAFRQRTLTKKETAAVQELIEQLGDKSFAKRERASTELIAQGSKVVGLLRAAADTTDTEQKRRVEMCLKEIALHAAKDKLPLSAPRLLVVRKPEGATEALLGYLAFADDRGMTAEIVKATTHLVLAGGKADVAVLDALNDELPVRRIAAAEILINVNADKYGPAVRKLLADADITVRLRVAITLVHAQDKEAVPTLIDLVAELPRNQAWEAEDLLHRIAGAKAPDAVPGQDAAGRQKYRDAWSAWWKDNAAEVDLAQLTRTAGGPGLIVVAELGPKGNKGPAGKFGPGGGGFPGGGPGGGGPGGFGGGGPGGAGFNAGPLQAGGGKGGKGGKGKGKGPAMPANPPIVPVAGTDRLVALDRNGVVHWQIENLEYPIDFQMLAPDRVLIAEYYANRVTERDLTGKILWEVSNLGRPPISVQRLPNGHTFIVLYRTPAQGGGSMVEVDAKGTIVSTIENPANAALRPPLIRAAYKMPDGQIICAVSNDTCYRLDGTGKEVKHFNVPLYGGAIAVVVQVPSFAGNLDVTAKGTIVVLQSDNLVAEYDLDGKLLWKAPATGNRAMRVPSGHTLVTSETTGVFEVDSAGKPVWQYQPPAGYLAVRARQVGDARMLAKFGDAPPVVGKEIALGPLSAKLVAKKTDYVLDRQGMTVDAYREAVKAGKIVPPAVDLVLEITNTTKQDVDFAVAGTAARLTLDLRGKAGGIETRSIAKTKDKAGRTILKPGQTYSIPISQLAGNSLATKSDQFFWTEPGEYTLSVTFETTIRDLPKDGNPPGFGKATKATVQSEPVKLKVTLK
jgi:hypothetical protein